ncbi:hypothetical protein AGABI1DRAFT_66440 [Agaricus bisporus var. burnettii JB137-S8]|uniref:sterol 22-desaturase n=2 Tax=Agaricus bisporus var. burnettii TaxID=192524 RepID=K5Y670_AGABU|nr:uncharacterized protein AGABI1DRAFT_66440 [Agaricus bisporus var. burnettii JB137-S8]EKM83625.1 hypothetical protein AGABI1DRAFT_66440 [Agaricus bisporus var. burnettii JB137-S8]KAF7784558.1 hypothetical protein Agabi119p4_723 [Agaricus bisporus var. burnettii]
MVLDVHAALNVLHNASYSYAPPAVQGSTLTWFYTTFGIIGGLLALEQAVYRYKKRHLPGDSWTIPVIGRFADSMSPTMEGYQKQWDSGPLSVVSVFNIFIVMASSNQYARKILNSPMYAEPALVHSGKLVIGSDNWVFLTGKDHVDYRKVLNLLFTRKALGIYLGLQDSVARKHYTKWLDDAVADPSAKPIMMTARQANMETSLRVFCGYYIPENAVEEINDKYWCITQSLELVNFPLPLPGTKVYKAIQARKFVMHWLEFAASKSKLAMAEGGTPECMMDEWVSIMAEPGYKGRKDFSNYEMAQVVFSFLFASQDAMSSGVIYGFQHLADHPDILEKVRQEQERVRMGNYEDPLTLEMLDEMVYLQAVVKESLRIKPPVTMVPYKCKKPFPINENYTVPVGSMVIPSFYNSLHDSEIYPEPEKFYPERWLDSKGSANSNSQNYLVFGSGPHKCIGLEYAQMTIALMLANAAVLMNFEHEITPRSGEVEIIATLFPKDGCRLRLSPRAQA